MKTIFSLLLITITASQALFGQTPNEDIEILNKYWHYRDAFRKNFIRIGSDRGQS
jgi:amino acid permease